MGMLFLYEYLERACYKNWKVERTQLHPRRVRKVMWEGWEQPKMSSRNSLTKQWPDRAVQERRWGQAS